MKRLFITLLSLSGFTALAQADLSPTLLRNIEFIFDDKFIDYTRMVNIDPTVNPIDTFIVVDLEKDGNAHYLNGREWSDTVYSNWNCETVNGVNKIYIVDAQYQDTVQIEHIYRDSQNRDTLYQVFADTSGNGNLALAQELQLFYGINSLDSVKAGIPGQAALGNINYYFFRDANGSLDSLLAAVSFMGTNFPVQTVRYYYGSVGLDSVNLYNNISGEVEEQARTTNNSNGAITGFSFYEKDANDEWSVYDTYYLSDPNFFNLPEGAAAQAKIQLFPNPSTRFINIETEGNGSFEIIDLQGKLILSGSLDQKDQIKVESLTKGSYLLRLKTDKGLIGEKRFVKH